MTTEHHLMTGQVWHHRDHETVHGFAYPLALVLVDLAEPQTLVRRHPLWGERWRPVSLRARDYIDPRDRPVGAKVREKATEHGLDFSGGKVLMLGQPRALGLLFNPLILYFHIPSGAQAPDALLAEVHNTPWGERHFYAHSLAHARSRLRFEHRKDFHVSPFLPMHLTYDWSVDWTDPLRVRIAAHKGGRVLFEAGMQLRAERAGRTNMMTAVYRFTVQGLLTRFRIYRQALRLWRLRSPLYSHPDKRAREGG